MFQTYEKETIDLLIRAIDKNEASGDYNPIKDRLILRNHEIPTEQINDLFALYKDDIEKIKQEDDKKIMKLFNPKLNITSISEVEEFIQNKKQHLKEMILSHKKIATCKIEESTVFIQKLRKLISKLGYFTSEFIERKVPERNKCVSENLLKSTKILLSKLVLLRDKYIQSLYNKKDKKSIEKEHKEWLNRLIEAKEEKDQLTAELEMFKSLGPVFSDVATRYHKAIQQIKILQNKP
eukprot:GHVP01031052.1.p1 GENE.GHVP01031052.1~~GHVP01031052.1.p1  ORF type:complete len:237 (-),score=47.89 GHVP01031052.1:287-997(-)